MFLLYTILMLKQLECLKQKWDKSKSKKFMHIFSVTFHTHKYRY